MTTLDPILLIILASFAVGMFRWSRTKSVLLPSHKFWHLVHSQEKPVVLLTTKGYLIKKLFYVFPYQGILFCTDAKETEAPDGVTLIGTGHSFSLS